MEIVRASPESTGSWAGVIPGSTNIYLPGEPQPVIFSIHGAIAQHYKIDPSQLTESQK